MLLDRNFKDYQDVLCFFIRNVPNKRYGCKHNKNVIKYATWHEANKKEKSDITESAVVKNNSLILKIYNKGKHLQDKGVFIDDSEDILRIEYTFKSRSVLKTAFGGNDVFNITDEGLSKLFKKYFMRDIVDEYEEWKKINHKQLIEFTKYHQGQNKQWFEPFIRDCRSYSSTHGLPLLFDVNDMQSVFKELELKGGRNYGKKFNNFKKQAFKYEKLVFMRT